MIKHRNINSTVLTAKESKHMCSFLIVTCSFNCQSKLCLKQEGKAPVLFNVCERIAAYTISDSLLCWLEKLFVIV